MAGEKESETQPIEYSIYTYQFSRDGGDGQWEKREETEDMDYALKQAQKLFKSGQYRKVEVKKKYQEEKTGRKIDMTLRVFEGRDKKDRSLALVIGLALAAGAAAFAIAFMLGG